MIRLLVMCLAVLSVAGASANEKPLKVLMIGNSGIRRPLRFHGKASLFSQ